MADKRARILRRRMTPQEVKLWIHLRTWRASGFHFRRQAPLHGCIVDFLCLKHRLVVELDGGGHARHEQSIADQRRDARLSAAGFHVLRFWNRDVDANLQGVLDAIHVVISPGDSPMGTQPRTVHMPRVEET